MTEPSEVSQGQRGGPLAGKRIVVGISGGIAAFKATIVVRELQRRGAQVRVCMTKSAEKFVGKVTFAGITGNPAVTDLWDPSYPGEVHVALADWADAMVIVPATMNVMARLVSGMADDVVLATAACRNAPLLVAPAMHSNMWNQPSTRRNVQQLKDDGVHFAGPTSGPLASGESGQGRMLEPTQIVDELESIFHKKDLRGMRVVVSAGPTFEDLDPVRFLGNRSTGRMGFSIARAAAQRGADVVLVAGPSALTHAKSVRRVNVRSAREMHAAVVNEQADVVIMAAAVADYRPATKSEHKIKKKDGELSVELTRNPDILQELGQSRRGRSPVLVGFALETENMLEAARGKLKRKGADLIVANRASDAFGKATNRVTFVTQDTERAFDELSKHDVAHEILNEVRALVALSTSMEDK